MVISYAATAADLLPLVQLFQYLLMVSIPMSCAHTMGSSCWLSHRCSRYWQYSLLVVAWVTATAGSRLSGSCGNFGVGTVGTICAHTICEVAASSSLR